MSFLQKLQALKRLEAETEPVEDDLLDDDHSSSPLSKLVEVLRREGVSSGSIVSVVHVMKNYKDEALQIIDHSRRLGDGYDASLHVLRMVLDKPELQNNRASFVATVASEIGQSVDYEDDEFRGNWLGNAAESCAGELFSILNDEQDFDEVDYPDDSYYDSVLDLGATYDRFDVFKTLIPTTKSKDMLKRMVDEVAVEEVTQAVHVSDPGPIPSLVTTKFPLVCAMEKDKEMSLPAFRGRKYEALLVNDKSHLLDLLNDSVESKATRKGVNIAVTRQVLVNECGVPDNKFVVEYLGNEFMRFDLVGGHVVFVESKAVETVERSSDAVRKFYSRTRTVPGGSFYFHPRMQSRFMRYLRDRRVIKDAAYVTRVSRVTRRRGLKEGLENLAPAVSLCEDLLSCERVNEVQMHLKRKEASRIAELLGLTANDLAVFNSLTREKPVKRDRLERALTSFFAENNENGVARWRTLPEVCTFLQQKYDFYLVSDKRFFAFGVLAINYIVGALVYRMDDRAMKRNV